MVVISCPIDGCLYKTEDVSETLVVRLLELHMMSHSSQMSGKGPKLTRPIIDVGADDETWTAFRRRWETFRKGSRIVDEEAVAQLFECASPELSTLVLKLDQDVTSRGTEEVLSLMYSLAVIPVAKGVIRSELMKLEQKDGESFRTFAARVKGKAETCGFLVKTSCECGKAVKADYTTEMMRDVLLAGIADEDIRREAMSYEGIMDKPTNELIAFVERREMSRNAASSSHSVAALSTFKREKKLMTNAKESESRPCPTCKKMYKPFRLGRRGWNRKAYACCFDCWQKDSKVQKCGTLQNSGEENATHDSLQLEVSELGILHRIFENNLLNGRKVSRHPKVNFKLTHVKTQHTAEVSGVADTGAQSNLWGLQDFKNKGFNVKDLAPVTQRISAANNHPLYIVGAFEAHFEGKSPTGTPISCESIVYVSNSVSNFYLSYDTMKSLGIIGVAFPTIGVNLCKSLSEIRNGLIPSDKVTLRDKPFHLNSVEHATGSGKTWVGPHSDATKCCKCPPRENVPERPKTLPFDPVPENIPKMKEWLLNRFASSTFNVCPHRPLQQMVGPPLEMHVDENAEFPP